MYNSGISYSQTAEENHEMYNNKYENVHTRIFKLKISTSWFEYLQIRIPRAIGTT